MFQRIFSNFRQEMHPMMVSEALKEQQAAQEVTMSLYLLVFLSVTLFLAETILLQVYF